MGIEQWTPGWFREEILEGIDPCEFYIARDGTTVVGCFVLDPESPTWMRPWLIEKGLVPTEAAHLGRLAVVREAARRGLGLQLLNEALRLAGDRGFAYVRLDCPAENERLRRYYRDAGFSHVGDVKTRGPNGEDWTSSVFERRTEVRR